MVSLRGIIVVFVSVGLVTQSTARRDHDAASFRAFTVCESPFDLELVLDGSGSINDNSWLQVKKFSANLVSSFQVSVTGTRIGVVQFSSTTDSRYEIRLTGNATAVLATVTSMVQLKQGTDIARGINLGQADFDQLGRNNTPRIMIMMTDGANNANSNPIAAASAAKAKGTEIFVLGVGPEVDWATLEKIASSPVDGHKFNISSFSELQNVINKLITKTCVQVTSVDPGSGPSTGGSAVLVTGEGFSNTGTILCKFGSTTVKGDFGDPNHIICKSPPGVGTVPVTISLDNGESFSGSTATFTYIQPAPVAVVCPNDCSGNGVCFNGKCFCNKGWNGPSCNQLPCPVPDCSGHGTCNNGTCVCSNGWTGPYCQTNACPNDCSRHGFCVNNTCVCDKGWTGADCSQGQILCCRYCSAYPNQPWSWWAECDVGKCGGFPDRKLVESFPVHATDVQDCTFHSDCIRNTGFCNT